MVILAIETSTKVCSAAVVADGVAVAMRMDSESGNHAKRLPVFIEELLSEVKQRGLKIDAVSLSEGPGSYTGLRIGTSMAKGLCYGLDVPLIPIPTTEVLCLSLIAEHTSPEECYLMPMIDARRMEVYTGVYRFRAKGDCSNPLELIGEVEAKVMDEWANGRMGESFYFGDGAAKCKELLESETQHLVTDVVPNAAYMAGRAEEMFQQGKGCRTAHEIAYYEPFYLKEFVAAKSHVKGLGDS